MKKTISMLVAAAAVAVMSSSSADALCVSVKTNLQTNSHNTASNRQNCDYNTVANRQFATDGNKFVNDQTGKVNRAFSTQKTVDGNNELINRQRDTRPEPRFGKK